MSKIFAFPTNMESYGPVKKYNELFVKYTNIPREKLNETIYTCGKVHTTPEFLDDATSNMYDEYKIASKLQLLYFTAAKKYGKLFDLVMIHDWTVYAWHNQSSLDKYEGAISKLQKEILDSWDV